MLNIYIMFSNSKNNRLNNRDFNIDENNRDYDFFHNRAALPVYLFIIGLGHSMKTISSINKVYKYK